jgi:hypothetical protein
MGQGAAPQRPLGFDTFILWLAAAALSLSADAIASSVTQFAEDASLLAQSSSG